MSYARFGPDSDVYVYLNVGGFFSCCACRLSPDSERFDTTAGMLAHLDQHVAAGHAVPESCFKGLRAEAAENDEWIAAGAPEGD